jgi:hypothetical protein
VSVMTDDERAELAEATVPTAAHMVCLVHGDGGPEDIQAVLDGLSEVQRTALIVMLAGMVDPDRPLRVALGWAGSSPGGSGEPAGEGEGPSIRQAGEMTAAEISLEQATVEDDAGFVDEIAVQAYLNGRRVRVTDAERLEAIRRGVLQRGMTYLDFDISHGAGEGTTATWVHRQRERAARDGRPFPKLQVPGIVGKARSLEKREVVEIRELAAQGVPDTELARQFGASRRVIVRIVSGETHKKAGGPLRSEHAQAPRSRRVNAVQPEGVHAGEAVEAGVLAEAS